MEFSILLEGDPEFKELAEEGKDKSDQLTTIQERNNYYNTRRVNDTRWRPNIKMNVYC